MTCVVPSFPCAKKRGRKAKNGPKAAVTVLDELAEPAKRSLYDREGDSLANLLAERMLSRLRSWTAFRAENPQVIEFPDAQRYRTAREGGIWRGGQAPPKRRGRK